MGSRYNVEMQGGRCVVLVNTDFESRKGEPAADGPRSYEADAAVLDTAREVGKALGQLGIETEELHVASSLHGVARALRARAPTVVFNLVESIDNDYGREWQAPNMLARHGFAYTGNGPTPLKLCRAKDLARDVLTRTGVRVARGLVLQTADAADIDSRASAAISYPAFIKPARVDGSIGVDAESLVQSPVQLAMRLKQLREAAIEGPFLVEEYLPGKEINVAIFPSPESGFVVATEIDFSTVPEGHPRFVTYDCKWNAESPEYAARSIPAKLEPSLRSEVEALARGAFKALGGSGYGRVDMRLDVDGRPCVIDVNPNNDIHPDAGLATAARSVDVTYTRLIELVYHRALEVQRAAASHSRG